MKYAVISDIHGNLPALEAVLTDAESLGVSRYIFAGDYCLSGPYPDGCVTALRKLENKSCIIRGNEEKYLENLIGKDQSGWTDGQMQISYWCFRNIGSDNMDYLMNLPHTADLSDNGTKIHIAHSSSNFIGDAEFDRFGPAVLAEKYKNPEITPEMLRREISDIFGSDTKLRGAVSRLDGGVYIFGHSHIQWSYKSKERNVRLINPGSCGLPLDGIKNSVPYTVLTVSGGGYTDIEERRVPFDKEKYAEHIRTTGQYAEANVWSKVIIQELLTAREHLTFFLQFAERYADDIGDRQRPFSVGTWENAYDAWESSVNGQEDI